MFSGNISASVELNLWDAVYLHYRCFSSYIPFGKVLFSFLLVAANIFRTCSSGFKSVLHYVLRSPIILLVLAVINTMDSY